ncbi:MAG: thermonuclease family protein [Ornithinimicrobium sp.]
MSPGSAASALVALAVVFGGAVYLLSDRGAQPPVEGAQTATVARVIDGDTFTALDSSGEDLGRVRVLGIDTPEMARQGQPAQCHAQAATTAAEDLLQGQTVQISHDPTQDRQDVYGRLLVYVDVDGTDYAQTMLSAGHARTYDQLSNPLARQANYEDAAREAQRTGSGLWGDCP